MTKEKTRAFPIRFTESEIGKIKERGGSSWVRRLVEGELRELVVAEKRTSKPIQTAADIAASIPGVRLAEQPSPAKAKVALVLKTCVECGCETQGRRGPDHAEDCSNQMPRFVLEELY